MKRHEDDAGGGAGRAGEGDGVSERDDAEVTLRLTADERRVVVACLRFACKDTETRIGKINQSTAQFARDAVAILSNDLRTIRRVLALVTEDGDE